MWYVVQVLTGTEENIRMQCEKHMPEAVLERCFIPYYEERKNIRGKWTTQKRVLFPGYIFVITEQLGEVIEKLRSVIGLTKLLGTGHFGGEEQVVDLTQSKRAYKDSFK